MQLIDDSGRSHALALETDSADYHVLTNAVKRIKHVKGILCEMGTRRGGSLALIVSALLDNEDLYRNVVCIDPYGNIEYSHREGVVSKLDYTNQMRNECMISIYAFLLNRPVNVVFHCLEDTEFFNRYDDGVPFYNETKTVETKYALVFFDGPHDKKSILREIDFFHRRSAEGAMWIFDDLSFYDHDAIERVLFDKGWSLVEKTGVKGSYTNAT